MNLQVSLEVLDHDALLADLLDERGHLKGSFTIGCGVALLPQFTAIKTKRAVGAPEILQFVLSIPVGIATGVAANALYNWLIRSKVPKARIKTTEIVLTEKKEHTVHLITRVIDKD